MSKSKITIAVALLLTLTFTISLVTLPPASGHDPIWKIPSYAYIILAPNPVGVGQTVSITMWIDEPLPSANVNNDIRRRDYTLTITAPDGTIKTQHWDIVQDTTSIQFYQFAPEQVGTYTLKFDYAGQTYVWNVTGSVYGGGSTATYFNDIFEPASKTTTLTVQAEPLPPATNSYPLPTEYWSRPIEGQNTDWYSISSNWLGSPYIEGAAEWPALSNLTAQHLTVHISCGRNHFKTEELLEGILSKFLVRTTTWGVHTTLDSAVH